jgi:methyl-accepting chemotaxis protein
MSTEGGNIIESAIGEINAIATAVQSTASDIHSLSESSARISSIVQVIREVAEQTNLLALNAAIEAARAGESGRGFAVVADEVRKLAERTSGATAEIAQMIDRIQADTHSSVTTTEKAIAQVDRGVALASQAGQAIQQIRRSVDQVVNVVADIELAIGEQRSASQQIAQRVEQVAQVSEENGVAARQTADTACEMSALASQLQATAGRFTL